MTLLPGRALATVYTFHDTETSALSPTPANFTFSLDTAAASVGPNGTSFRNVIIDCNGTLVAGNTVAASFTTNLASPLFFLIDTSALPFYSGSGTAIAFNTGTFAIADGATEGEGILTISATALSPTPEPATWTLFCAGLGMTGIAFRVSRAPVTRNQGTI